MTTDLIFVGDPCCDHSASSGYHQVCHLFPNAAWLSGRRLADGEYTWIRGDNRALAGSPVFHVFYADCSGRAAATALRARHPASRIVASVHQPVERLLRDREAMSALSVADAIVAVARDQADQIRQLGLSASVHAIPHGVWTDNFSPAAERRPVARPGRDRVLLVGNYLRDWELARDVVNTLTPRGLRCLVLGSAVPPGTFNGNELVLVADRVSEAELIELYDTSAAMFLPVLAATASNAVLEAMAAGCPVVCPAIPSLVDDYLGSRDDAFDPRDPARAVDLLLGYASRPDIRERTSRRLARRVAMFDWMALKPQFAAVLAGSAPTDLAPTAATRGTGHEEAKP